MDFRSLNSATEFWLRFLEPFDTEYTTITYILRIRSESLSSANNVGRNLFRFCLSNSTYVFGSHTSLPLFGTKRNFFAVPVSVHDRIAVVN